MALQKTNHWQNSDLNTFRCKIKFQGKYITAFPKECTIFRFNMYTVTENKADKAQWWVKSKVKSVGNPKIKRHLYILKMPVSNPNVKFYSRKPTSIHFTFNIFITIVFQQCFPEIPEDLLEKCARKPHRCLQCRFELWIPVRSDTSCFRFALQYYFHFQFSLYYLN